MLYLLLLLVEIPVTRFACTAYGWFGILAAVCIYGLIINRDTSSQNIGMGITGDLFTAITVNILSIILDVLFPSSLKDQTFIL